VSDSGRALQPFGRPSVVKGVEAGAQSGLAGVRKSGTDAARAEAEGPDALDVRALLQLVAGEGAGAAALEELAREDLGPLARRSPHDLRARSGLSRAAALRLAAAFALGRRVENAVSPPRVPLSGRIGNGSVSRPNTTAATAAPLVRVVGVWSTRRPESVRDRRARRSRRCQRAW